MGATPTPVDLGLPVAADRLTFGSFVHDVASRFADRDALVFDQRRLTYRQLLTDARRFARGLLAAGVPKGAKVAILLGNRPEFAVAAFGIGMAGGVVVPISTFATPGERDHVLRHSDATLLVLQPELRSHHYLADLAADHPDVVSAPPAAVRSAAFPFLRRVVTLGERWDAFLASGDQIGDGLLDAARAQVLPYDDAIIVYTSGTTAEPKAVLHTHRSVTVHLWRWARLMGLSPEDRVWSAFPLFWTAGFSMVLGGTLASGACLVMEEAFDAGEALDLIEHERVTTIHCFEHVESQLADHPSIGDRDLSALRNVRPISPIRKVAKLPESSWDPRSGYGSSETFTVVTALPIDAPMQLRQESHGLTLEGMRIRIVDPVTGEPLPTAATGEITVKGVTLMRGYYKVAPEECLDDEGWFHTQDAGYLDEQGYLHWTGRMSGLIKTAGANVSPIEVEYQVAQLRVFGVASVVGVPHPTVGEVVVMCAVPLREVTPDLPDVLDRLRQRLASYKVPRRILLFTEAELAFTSSDKVQLDEVRRLAAERIIATDEDEGWVAFLRERYDP